MCVHICASMYVCIRRSEVEIGNFPYCFSTLFFETRSQTSSSSLGLLSLASLPQGSSASISWGWNYICGLPWPPEVMWAQGKELWSSIMQSKCVNCWTISPAPFACVLTQNLWENFQMMIADATLQMRDMVQRSLGWHIKERTRTEEPWCLSSNHTPSLTGNGILVTYLTSVSWFSHL